MTWSKIDSGPVDRNAYFTYYNNGLAYHNAHHIANCYKFLEEYGAPYDKDLDIAVLYHDIVYDSGPDKELRSANFVSRIHPDCAGAQLCIIDTIHHRLLSTHNENRRWMIRADLSGLASTKSALRNYVLIMDESCDLYNIDVEKFAINNLAFMCNLHNTVTENLHHDHPEFESFWLDVLKGIDFTMNISEKLLCTSSR